MKGSTMTAVLESSDYQATRDALAANPIMVALFHRDRSVLDITEMDDSKLAAEGIAWVDEKGNATPRHSFMMAANARFHEMEEANPKYRYEGPMHIGAVAEVILAHRAIVDHTRRQAIEMIAARTGNDYGVTAESSRAEVRAAFDRAGGGLHKKPSGS